MKPYRLAQSLFLVACCAAEGSQLAHNKTSPDVFGWLFRKNFLIAPLVLCLLLCRASLAQDVMSPEETGMVLLNFYRQPSFDVLTNIIRSVESDTSYRSNQTAQLTITAFYAAAFERYPEKLGAINKLSDSLRYSKKLIQAALRMNEKRDAILTLDREQPHMPVMINMLCAAFLASGEPKYLKRVVSELTLCDRKDSIVVRLTGYTAKFSLSLYAREIPEVKEYLEESLGNAPPALATHLREALDLSPGQILIQVRELAEEEQNSRR